MGLAPDVDIQFSDGNLGILPASTTNVFAFIGPSALGLVNSVYPIADPNAVMSTLGDGPLPEAVAQVLGNTSTLVYAIPANKTAGSIGSVTRSRAGSPTLTVASLMGLPGAWFSPNPANTGTGNVQFDATTTPQLSSVNDTASVTVTAAGALGAAVATIVIGSNTYTSQTLSTTPWTDPGLSGVVLDFTVPLGGRFEVGDSFTAIATPNDAYNVLITITSINDQGQALWTYSLDGGVTTSSPISANLGGAIVATGATTPTLALGGSAPSGDTSYEIVITFTQQGTATGPVAQAGNGVGYLYNSTSPTAAHGTAKITTPASGQTVPVTVSITGTGTAVGSASNTAPTTGTGTAAGSVTINGVTTTFAANHFPATYTDSVTGVVVTFDGTTHALTSGDSYTNAGVLSNDNGSGDSSTASAAITTATTGATSVSVSFTVSGDGTAATAATSGSPATGTGTATGTLVIGGNSWNFDTSGGGSGGGGVPSQFTDATTGIVIKFATGAGDLKSGDVWTITVLPKAEYTISVNGSSTTGQTIPANGGTTIPGVSGPTLSFAHTKTDIYTYSSGTPSSTTTYTFYIYPAYSYGIRERNGLLVGLALSFGFGTYETDDEYAFQTVAPSVVPTDAITALNAALATSGIDFSMVHFPCAIETYSSAATLATDVQTVLNTQAQSPTYRFISAAVYGPDVQSTVSGATPTNFISATGELALNRIMMMCGADFITSALTQRRDQRNCGYVISARLAAITPSTDPGENGNNPLTNDVATTTSYSDMQTFVSNRGTTTRTNSGQQGVFCAEGLTLAGTGSDYGTIENRRVADEAAKVTRQALLPYVNSKVPTLRDGSGRINAIAALAIQNDVSGKILAAMGSEIQSVTVAVNTTTNVLSTGVLPVTVTLLPFGYARYINVTIGFTVNAG